MNILFIHQNFPGQYKRLAPALAAAGHRVVGLGETKSRPGLPGVVQVGYQSPQPAAISSHPYLRDLEVNVRRAQLVVRALHQLKCDGFRPDLIYVHPGWGEALYLKDFYPDVPLIGFFEYFYQSKDGDLGFDPEFPAELDQYCKMRTRNAHLLISLDAVDVGICPTNYQKSVHPQSYGHKLCVIHDGINTDVACPNPEARFTFDLNNETHVLSRNDEVITYVSRNLEPYRGYHTLMRALPELLELRPNAKVIIVGGHGVSYGPRAPIDSTWKDIYFNEVMEGLDCSRVFFIKNLPYRRLIQLFQVSRVHVYLTYPFALSWSLLEAMSCGCLVVGSSTSPVNEIIEDEKTGLLVDFFDPKSLCKRVNMALTKLDQIQMIRDQARAEMIKRFDFTRVCLPMQKDLIRACTGSA